MEVLELPLDDILVEDRYRQDLGDLGGLIESIRDKGLIQPITVDQNYKLLAGGRRYAAVRALNLERISVIVRQSDTKLDSLEIELIENVHRKDLGWLERGRLERAVLELKGTLRSAAEALGVTHPLVYRHVQLAKAVEEIPELAACKNEAEAWKTLQKMKESLVVNEIAKRAAARAEVDTEFNKAHPYFSYAQSNYMIGDATQEIKKLHSGMLGFAEVDPPYGIGLDKQKKYHEGPHQNIQDYTEIEADDYNAFLSVMAREVYRVLDGNTFCIWWFGHSNYQIVLDALQIARFTVNEVPAVWDKGEQGQTNNPDATLANCYESFFVCRKGRPLLRKPGRGNIFRHTPVAGGSKIHATERPLSLMLDLLTVFASPGQRIISPFLGSGVTLRACYHLNMSGCGWDLEESIRNKFLLQVHEEFGDE